MTGPAQRPLTAVIRDILDDVQDIARSEIQLAKSEVREEIAAYSRGIGRLLTAAMCLFFAAALLLLSCFCALLYVLPLWAAALVLAGVMGVIGMMILWLMQNHRNRTTGSPPWQKHPAR